MPTPRSIQRTYLVEVGAPFWAWAVVSALIGLGFTFFSGALQAWVVDALTATGFTGDMESVFGRGQAVTGAAMLPRPVAAPDSAPRGPWEERRARAAAGVTVQSART